MGLAAGCLGPAGLRRLRRAAAVGRRPVPVDGGHGGRPGPLVPAQRSGLLHHRPARRGLDRALAAARPGRSRPGGVHLPPRPPGPCRQGSIAHATAYMAAAHKYQLWVNGVPGRHRPELLLPRRAVLPGHRRHLGAGPGQPQRRRRPPPLVRAGPGPPGLGPRPPGPGGGALRRRHSVVTIGSDGTWRARRAEWLPAPPAEQRRGRLRRVDRRPAAPHRMVGARLRRPRLVAGRGARAGGDRALHRPLRPAHPDHRARCVPAMSLRTLPTGSVVVDFGKVYAGRPTVAFRQGTDGHTVPMHVGYTLDPDGAVSTTHNTQGTDLSFSYTQRSGAQGFEPYCYLGFRYLQIDDPGEPIDRRPGHPASPATPPCPTSTAGHLLVVRARCSTRCGTCAPTRASTPPRSSSSTPRPGRRASSCGTRPTSPRRSCGPTATRT